MGFLNFFKKKKQTVTTSEEKQVELPNVVADDKVNDILNQEILEFFPKDGTWWSCCFKRANEIGSIYLPCHLRDNDWMSKLLHQNLIEKKIYISAPKIKEFMDSSETFTELRHNYELEIVRWQIDWIRKGGENWIIPEGFDDFSILFSPDVDKMFRGGVVKTLSAIGMNREVIEEGIEKNVDMWRERYMELAFEHVFEPIAYLRDSIEPADEDHKKNWLRLRRYEYYTEHKDSVDKYGEVTPDMQLSIEELSKLQSITNQQNKEREQVVDYWKKHPQYKHSQSHEDEQE